MTPLNPLGNIIAALALGKGAPFDLFKPRAMWRGPTPQRKAGKRRGRSGGRLEKMSYAYQVRYTHMFSRIHGRTRILDNAVKAANAGNMRRARELQDAAESFPW